MTSTHRTTITPGSEDAAGATDPDATDPGAAAHATPSASKSRHSRRRFLLGGAALLGVSAAGGSAWALDRFVIDHVEVADASAYEAANSVVANAAQATASADQITLTDTSYTSPTTSIRIGTTVTGSGADTLTYYTADITVSDATAVRSAFASNQFGLNITAKPSEIASVNNAVLAINGDYYGFRETGILIRNGTVYRDSPAREGIAFYTDGHVEIYDETATSARALASAGVWNTLSFGPALVRDGQVISGIDSVEVDTNVGNHSIQGQQPRTALGCIDTNHYMFVVVDGRSKGHSRGATMTELARIMADLGCQSAYNLDGGGSSAMYFNGSIINQPSNGGERGTSDVLYIAQGA